MAGQRMIVTGGSDHSARRWPAVLICMPVIREPPSNTGSRRVFIILQDANSFVFRAGSVSSLSRATGCSTQFQLNSYTNIIKLVYYRKICHLVVLSILDSFFKQLDFNQRRFIDEEFFRIRAARDTNLYDRIYIFRNERDVKTHGYE